MQKKKDKIEVEKEKQPKVTGLLKLDSARELVDGTVNSMPATNVDDLYAKRCIQEISSSSNEAAKAHHSEPTTSRLSNRNKAPSVSFKTYSKNSEFMKLYKT